MIDYATNLLQKCANCKWHSVVLKQPDKLVGETMFIID